MATTHGQEPMVYQAMTLPPRRKLDRAAPFTWLALGRQYFANAKALSLGYGALFGGIGIVITWLGLGRPQFILTFWSGFLLVGPLLAVGLYRIAQLQDRGEALRITNYWGALRGRLGSVALFSLLLSLVMIAWIRFSTLIAALYAGNIEGGSSFVASLATVEGAGFLALLFGVGAVFAAVMFALTAWSLPMLLDERTDFGTAVVSSVKATLEQPLPMLTWGAMVAGLTVIGMLTFFVAFVVIFPWLGYATWAGYRDLFGRD